MKSIRRADGLTALVLAPALAWLSACASDEIASQASGPPQESIPPYRKLVSEALSINRALYQTSVTLETAPSLPREWEIKNAEQYAPFEISDARQVHSFQGWAWLVCLKGTDHGQPVYFSFFIQHDRIINIRGNVGTDDCPHQRYEPLPLNTWPAKR
jgi:hypothetical protein